MQAKLLLIEDTASLAETLARGFGEAGFETRIAHTAAAASLALESDPPDALILDLGLPDLDGLELLAKIRSRGLVIPIFDRHDCATVRVHVDFDRSRLLIGSNLERVDVHA